MQNKITPFFWFNNELKEVIAYYREIFNTDAVGNFEEVSYNLISDMPGQKVELATVTLFGNAYHFMNAQGPARFNESFSLMINTADQAETDHYWDAFTTDGAELDCGWCRDKYGLCWQVTPKRLMELNSSPDKEIANYSIQQMMTMKKIIIADLEQ
jgi:predicted 3-demethylubiquinone-9 3-methyltransferase (glyoxalase superfamily)